MEFLGPLGVAVASSRRLLDVLWVGLAGSGVALLASGGTTATTGHGSAAAGFAFALLAGLSWAAYILLGRATGQRFHGSPGSPSPCWSPRSDHAGGRRGGRENTAAADHPVDRPGHRAALLDHPYSLEMEALRRIPPRLFGIWMSLEPAVAALVGLVLLGQSLAAREWLAIGCVMVACAGAARGAREPQIPEA